MRRRTARSGRGATTSPARSPIASEPGRASRSSATAAAIVAGMPMATRCRTRPSAPQSQLVHAERDDERRRPSRATPASSAVPHPRRMPSSRSDTLVTTTARHDADDDAARRRRAPTPTRRRRSSRRLPCTAGAPAPHSDETGLDARPRRPARRAAGTPSAASRATIADAFDVAVELEAVRHAGAVGRGTCARRAASGGSCSGRSKRRSPARRSAPRSAPSTAHVAGRPQASPRRRGRRPGRSRARTGRRRWRIAHAADAPPGRQRGDARHGARRSARPGPSGSSRRRCRTPARRRSAARPG